jgi:hypothetical protein
MARSQAQLFASYYCPADSPALYNAERYALRIALLAPCSLKESMIVKNHAIINDEEAQESLKRLERYYGQPVLPLGSFCRAMSVWKNCIVENNTDPALLRGAGNQGNDYFNVLDQLYYRYPEIESSRSPALCKGATSYSDVSNPQGALRRRCHVF